MIIKSIGIRCLECNYYLATVANAEMSYPKNPAYEYYYRRCKCNLKDETIIRIKKEKVQYEVVKDTKKDEDDH